MKHFILIAVICSVTVIPFTVTAIDFGERAVDLGDFVTRRTDDEGELLWKLQSQNAQMRSNVTHLKDATLKFYQDDGSTVTIKTPKCEYHKLDSKITGSSPISIHSSDMQLEGKNFDIFLDERSIFIRKKTKTILKRTQTFENFPQD